MSNGKSIEANVAALSTVATLAYPALFDFPKGDEGQDGAWSPVHIDALAESFSLEDLQEIKPGIESREAFGQWAISPEGIEAVYPEGPTIYPVPGYTGNPEVDQARLLAHTNCVLSEIGGQFFVSPKRGGNGGGNAELKMFDLATAYVVLGYLPPIYFTAITHMTNLEYNENSAIVLAACRATCGAVRDRAATRLQDLVTFTQGVQEQARTKAQQGQHVA